MRQIGWCSSLNHTDRQTLAHTHAHLSCLTVWTCSSDAGMVESDWENEIMVWWLGILWLLPTTVCMPNRSLKCTINWISHIILHSVKWHSCVSLFQRAGTLLPLAAPLCTSNTLRCNVLLCAWVHDSYACDDDHIRLWNQSISMLACVTQHNQNSKICQKL